MNLPLFLKNRSKPSAHKGISLVVFFAFSAGAALFYVSAARLFKAETSFLSPEIFRIAFSAIFVLFALLGFSQLGLVLSAALDAVFEFTVCCFSFYELSSGGGSVGLAMLIAKLFPLILIAMLLSHRASVSSLHLVSACRGDKACLADLGVNLVLLIILIIASTVICLNAL